jgi:NTE family protein
MNTPGTRKIGLALSGGAARGGAHLGVIRAIDEAGIRVDYVAGTSIGALVGAAYATGAIDQLERFTQNLDWPKMARFLDVALPFWGLIDGRKVTRFLEELVGRQSFVGLSPSLAVVACNLNGGREVVLRDGDLVEAVRASISIPGIFRPVIKDGDILVDGGLVNPVPVSAVREMGADVVIAVDLNHKTASLEKPQTTLSSEDIEKNGPENGSVVPQELQNTTNPLMRKIEALEISGLSRIRSWRENEVVPNLAEVLMMSLGVMETQVRKARFREDPPDLLIQPKVEHITFLEFHRAKELIDVGYEEAKSALTHWPG